MIVGLAGYARVGKGAAAKSLTPRFKTIAFADKLREVLLTLNPIVGCTDKGLSIHLLAVINEYGWEGYKHTEFRNEIRRLIQTLGTDCGRNMLGQNIWIDATFAQMNAPHEQDYVITDVRFPNEAKAIKDRGGHMIRVDRPGVGPINDHESETALDKYEYDAIIINEGSLAGLRWKLDHVVRHFEKSNEPIVV